MRARETKHSVDKQRSEVDTQQCAAAGSGSEEPVRGKIHPVVIFPYSMPKALDHLKRLYEEFVPRLKDRAKYEPTITVVNHQTRQRNEGRGTYRQAIKLVEAKSEHKPHFAWCVDTCQMWLAGLGTAYEKGKPGDVYWLIPGDFHYASAEARAKDEDGNDTLDRMITIPARVNRAEEGQTIELSLGEISVPLNSAKQLIDTYGTYALLYNWFPAEGKGIRLITDKPRTEFFAISHSYLSEVLEKRWYAYEQMLVILLRYMSGKEPRRKVARTFLGKLDDEEADRDTLSSAMMQVERTERVLKLYWREDQLRREPPDWRERFRTLDEQSGQIRGAALVILEQILRKQ